MKNCQAIITTGSCNNPQCRDNHNVLVCDICNMVFQNKNDYEQHCTSRRHITRAGTENPHGMVYCPICQQAVLQAQWSVHVSTKKHKRAARERSISVDNVQPDHHIPEGARVDSFKYCAVCQIYAPNYNWTSHINSRRHRLGQEYASYKAVQEETEKDKNDVTVQGSLDFNIVDPIAAQRGVIKTLTIHSTSPLARITLVHVTASSDLGVFRQDRLKQPAFVVTIDGSSRELTTSKSIKINVSLRQEYIGRYTDRIEILLKDKTLNKQFIITRVAQAIIGDSSLHEELKPRAPYVPRVRAPREPETRVVEGVRPPSLNAIPYVGKLKKAAIPNQLLASLMVSSTALNENVKNIQRAFLPRDFGPESLGQHMKILLWIEEFKMERDLERYDMVDASLTQNLPYYHLVVPGLAEKRPSVLVGDRMFVRANTSQEGHWYEGHVHFVHQCEVGLRFHESFKGWSSTQKYHIRFKFNRIPLQRQHKALNASFTQSRVLFPDSSHLPNTLIPTANLVFFNNLLVTNSPQIQAVSSILQAAPGSLPFIVFGPPGTGKTVTIVEAIKQLLKKNPTCKILACAPSNSAADLIAIRLRDLLNKDQMFRMYAPSRNRNQVPDELESYIYYRDNGISRPCFSVPPMATMKQFRVIVTTCISASITSGIGMARGHFSHIFIDEVGQATEPEVYVSIKTMADQSTNIVLSGDPKQLGPIIRSGLASRLGLEVSCLERLMERPPYEIPVGYGKSIVKLVKNFRSHNAILKFPNERFYNGELQACGFTKDINAYLGSAYLPKKDFPIVFHAVYGKDDRESTSPSFFNVDEITQVRTYIEQLKSDRVYRTRDEDIGVIAPYHAQCQRIRRELKKNGAGQVKVGSVEEFQGQERKVIIISTVRSSKEYVTYDVRHTLGFVASPRRFNVAVTRAKALLIIVGDPEVLGLDPLWRSFLNYIHDNGGWKGPNIPWDPSQAVNETGNYDAAIRENATLDMNDFTRRMESLTMGEMGDEDLDAGVDKPWRDLD